jgi:hypothetical protein
MNGNPATFEEDFAIRRTAEAADGAVNHPIFTLGA